MAVPKHTFAVFAATGSQGSAVASYLLTLSATYHVRALVRDASKPAAVELQRRGAQLVTASLNDLDSLHAALDGVDAVYLYTTPQPEGAERDEFELAKNALDACVKQGVKWVHFATSRGAEKRTGGSIKLAMYDDKERINEYILQQNIPATLYFLEGAFMTNFLGYHWLQPVRGASPAKVALRIPLLRETADFSVVSVQHDVPRLVEIVHRQVFGLTSDSSSSSEKARRLFWFHKEVDVFSERLTAQHIVQTLSDLSGIRVEFEYLSRETIHKSLPDLIPLLPLFELQEKGYNNQKRISDQTTVVPGDPIFAQAGMEFETFETYAKRELVRPIKQMAL